MAQFTFPANSSKIVINGLELFLMQDVSGEDNYGLEKCSGIGDIEGKDLVPSEATYRVRVNGYAVQTQSLVASGIWPEDAQAMVRSGELTIELYSTNPATLIKKWERARMETGTVNLVAHRQLMINATFQALKTTGSLGA